MVELVGVAGAGGGDGFDRGRIEIGEHVLLSGISSKSHTSRVPGHDIPPDMVVVVSDGSKLFHVPGCPFIHDKATERTMTAKEAMQDGYVPCSRCLRQYLKTGLTDILGASRLLPQ